MNPSDVITAAIGGKDDTSEIQSVVNSIMGALVPSDGAKKADSKRSLLESFNSIDGNISKRK